MPYEPRLSRGYHLCSYVLGVLSVVLISVTCGLWFLVYQSEAHAAILSGIFVILLPAWLRDTFFSTPSTGKRGELWLQSKTSVG